MIQVYDAKQKKLITEDQFGGDFLVFLYNTVMGRLLLKVIFLQPWFWKCTAVLQKRRSTIGRVNDYIRKYSIVKGKYVDGDWYSFYDFFGRQLKPGAIKFPASPLEVIAIAEAKLLVVPISRDCVVEVKHRTYDLASIVGSSELAAEYEGGTALIYRLSMHNYHRYLFPDDGAIVSTKRYKGVLHTVSSIAANYPVYSINQRHVSVLDTAHFHTVVMVEVGAMMAGKVVNHPVQSFERGQEKGYFEIGGSTILVLYKKATIVLNNDITKYSQKGIEVAVDIGESIGKNV